MAGMVKKAKKRDEREQKEAKDAGPGERLPVSSPRKKARRWVGKHDDGIVRINKFRHREIEFGGFRGSGMQSAKQGKVGRKGTR